MKLGKKKLTNKDFENRSNILMMELENLRRIVVNYIEYNNDIENLEKFMREKDKEPSNV
tara:strand:+ start:197 stop:373 length:177 start_codon:yes stop_codon:yes gene_type:complete